MATTDRGTVVAAFILDLIEDNKVTLGVDTVLYGIHDKIPTGICVAVTTGRKTRAREGVASPGGQTRNRMITLVTVYNSRIGDEGTERLFVDQLAEEIEALIHQDITLAGIVFDCFVEDIDPGFTYKQGTQFRSVQMTVTAMTKTRVTP